MDRAEIGELVHRFFRALDERRFTPGWTAGLLTDDARMETPLGYSRGAAAVRATEEALGRYDRTQHLASGIIADVDTTATASWNALMVHVRGDAPFMVGGRFEAGLRRTAGGWRFDRMAVRAIWTQGEPPAAVTAGPTAPRVG
ncbi:nuclear transport factor 2 family protein [Streptomyces misionensis]|uniref:Nuclear transport factor 2 family protein n=2 Tax=Streptomyces misionensis TaxID=67331 RepID=A0A5C6IN96_9ACTN|nr:nuclear transport factor 2 family protein [Streptomyces misionensis]